MATPKTAKEKKPQIVTVDLPKGCKKTNLSIDALDSYTRELALKTTVSVGGRPVFCRAIKLVDAGNEQCLQITLRPGSFELKQEK